MSLAVSHEDSLAVVSVAAIMAVGVNADGQREVLGMQIGTSGPSSCVSWRVWDWVARVVFRQ